MEVKKNITKGVCATKFCKNKTYGRKHCSTCRCKKTRQADPVKYAYQSLRNNAKRRNILFTITLEQFREWCSKVIYIGFSGRRSTSFTIDRRHNDIGYHIDNIEVMEKGENVKKFFYYDYRTRQTSFMVHKEQQSTEPDYF